MGKFVNIQNVAVLEPGEIAGICGGLLVGATVGAKIGFEHSWYLGPVVAPVAVASGIFIGGTVGAVGGGNLAKAIASQLNAQCGLKRQGGNFYDNR